MCDLLTDDVLAELRKLTVMRRIENAFDELLNATPAANETPERKLSAVALLSKEMRREY